MNTDEKVVTLTQAQYRELMYLARRGASQGRKSEREANRTYLADLDAKVRENS
jgi:hypothetical protein